MIFSLPERTPTLGVKVNRMLKDIGAEKFQNSVWRSENLRELTTIAIKIKGAGGDARILEEKIVY